MSVGTCAFCGRLRRCDNEHVIPRWVKDCLPPSRGDDHFAWQTKTERREWPSNEMGWKTGAVCTECHHSWMNDLENAVRPVLCDVIGGKGGVVPMAPEIAAWGTKIALLTPYLMPKAEPFPRRCYEHMYRHRTPDPTTLVWVGAYSMDKQQRIVAEGRYSKIPTDRKSAVADDDGYIFVAAIGHLVLKIETVPAWVAAMLVRAQHDGPLIRIWPNPPNAFVWPTPWMDYEAVMAEAVRVFRLP